MTTTPTTPATVDLRPCPFCGAAGQIVWPITLECACTNPKCALADSIEMTNLHILPEDWNRRAIDRRGGVDEAMIDRGMAGESAFMDAENWAKATLRDRIRAIL